MEKELPARISLIHYMCDQCAQTGIEAPMKLAGVQRQILPGPIMNLYRCQTCQTEIWITIDRLYPMIHVDVLDGKKGTVLTIAGLQPRNPNSPIGQ